jgi:hypothetical protein
MVVILKNYYKRFKLANKVVFTGCSFTAGNGWSDTDPTDNGPTECKSAPELWVNQCHSNIKILQDLELINFGIGGASNTKIFESTVDIISQHGNSIKFLFCQWTSYPRYQWNLGFELWPTSDSVFVEGAPSFDISTSVGLCYNKKDLEKFKNQYLVMHHPHWEIVKIIGYTKILKQLARLHGIKVYFINGLCHWDNQFFTKLTNLNITPEDYTPYTKKEILAIDFRNDSDIHKLYNLAHTQYTQAGGIDPTQWINLYNSMNSNIIDTNYDNLHPGKLSNILYFQLVKNFLDLQ